MGYYIRVLGTSPANVPLQQLRECASPALIEVDEGTSEDWEQLVLKHESGPEIALIEKNPVVESELGAEELREFLDEVPLHRPASAAVWLQNYLPTVKVIYAFQLLNGTDVSDGPRFTESTIRCGSSQAAFSKRMEKASVMKMDTLFCGSLGRL